MEEIQKNQLRDVTVRVINGLFWLEGIVTSKQDYDRAEAISAAYIPDRLESLARRTDSVQKAARTIIQNFIQINPKKAPPPIPKLIKVTAQFVRSVGSVLERRKQCVDAFLIDLIANSS